MIILTDLAVGFSNGLGTRRFLQITSRGFGKLLKVFLKEKMNWQRRLCYFKSKDKWKQWMKDV